MANINKAPGVGRPARTDKNNKIATSTERGTMPGDRRKSYIVSKELADKIDYIAYQERTSVKNVVNAAFADHIDKYEKKKGPLKVETKKQGYSL